MENLTTVCSDCGEAGTCDDLEKVYVSFVDGEFECVLGPEIYGGEFMWAKPVKGQENHYEIANIPFFAHDINEGDIVHVEQTEDHSRVVQEVIQASGKTTLWVMFPLDDVDEEEGWAPLIRELCDGLDVQREHAQNGYFALSVAEYSNSHTTLLERLDIGVSNGSVLSFQTNDGSGGGWEEE